MGRVAAPSSFTGQPLMPWFVLPALRSRSPPPRAVNPATELDLVQRHLSNPARLRGDGTSRRGEPRASAAPCGGQGAHSGMAARGDNRDLGWDEELSAAALQKFDAEFLAAERPPGRHFRHRLRLLMSALEPQTQGASPAVHGRLTVPPEDVDRELYAHVELVPLLHQLAEAVWSLLFAIAPDVRSPSLFLAQLQPAHLKSRLEAAEDPAHLEQLLMRALLLDAEAPDVGEEYWTASTRSLSAVQRLLVLAAARLKDDRRIYNATKHGFAVTSGRALIGFSADDPRLQPGEVPELDFGRSAVWLSVLERLPPDASGGRRWVITRTALDDLDQEFWLVLLLTQVLDLFWACGLTRRDLAGDLDVRLLTDADVDHLVGQPRDLLHKMVFDVLYAGQEGTIKMIVKPRR